MSLPPIVERELRVAARLPRTFNIRVLVVTGVAVVGFLMILVGSLSPSPSGAGRGTFLTLSYMILAFCLLEGIRTASDCVSRERRQGTLGFLFLSDLTGYDVVLGKLAANSIPSVCGLISVLPVLALSLLVGGVLAAEFWRMALALLCALFCSLCAGILVSSHCSSQHRALTGTLVFIVLWIWAPLVSAVPHICALSPLTAFFNAPETGYRRGAVDYWASVAGALLFNGAALAWAALAVSRLRSGSDFSPFQNWRARWIPGKRGRTGALAARRPKQLDLNPVFWLASRDMSTPWTGWLLLVVAISAVITVASPLASSFRFSITLMIMVNFALKVLVAARACRSLAEARANHALEMMLCTPLSAEDILRGQTMAIREAFSRPVAYLFAAETLGCAALMYVSGSAPPLLAGFALLIAGPLYFGLLSLDLMAVTWVGMWFGLSSKNESQAILRTVAVVLLVPCCAFFCFCFLWMLAVPLFYIWPLLCYLWAKQCLRERFRALATAGFGE
jgi:ABC-type transport system involved in multi-copper enzyme maturation permease subunit